MLVFPAVCPLFDSECFHEFEPCRKKCPYVQEIDISRDSFRPASFDNLGLRFLFMMLGISVHSEDFRPIMKENKPKVVGFGRH